MLKLSVSRRAMRASGRSIAPLMRYNLHYTKKICRIEGALFHSLVYRNFLACAGIAMYFQVLPYLLEDSDEEDE